MRALVPYPARAKALNFREVWLGRNAETAKRCRLSQPGCFVSRGHKYLLSNGRVV
jgi:hypothetical protein